MRKPLKCAGLLSGLSLLPVSFAVAAESGVNALNYPGPAWSPYVVGAGIGVLSWLTFYFSDKAIGASSFYAEVSGFIGMLFAKHHTKSLAYFKDKPPRVSWGFVFVLATIVGGAIAALTGGEFTNDWLPPMWEARFGDGITLRAVIGFSGGLLMAFGARLAGGCTSGHGISGTLQLNPGSWVFAELSGWSKRTVETWGDFGKVLLPYLLHVPRGVFVVILAVLIIGGLFVLESAFPR